MKIHALQISLAILAIIGQACSPGGRKAPPGYAPTAPRPANNRVTDQTPPTAVSEAVSMVQVFVVALEDAGNSGELIGCGDSLVPISLMIEPAEDALRASLAHLLALREQHVGESGLYNALYQSDLRVDEISIDHGSVEIRLVGSLQTGGVCDAPRIIGQLRATALHSVSLTEARFFINDRPIEELLSGK